MKMIGIIGGMGPASTLIYYDTLCQLARDRSGGNASARVIIDALDFGEIQALQQSGDWDEAGRQLAASGQRLEQAGAELILLATNTMHKVAAPLQVALNVPFVHIVDATAARLTADGRTAPALLGTRYTMEDAYYPNHFAGTFGAPPLIPDTAERDDVHRIIFDDLVKGIVTPETTRRYIEIVEALATRGADSVILGCTEIGLVLNTANSPLPVYDSARIHCETAMKLAIS
ncbi:aspartate/glutamate racemase family protein [Hyphomonas oceanitis]|uniref:Aspartate racemase n=1 Tax=Hyphomonas oceanitis SCH89 TaxID=1280953 RepID=A0A059GC12_9PROT|nr:aspartate/glutamate racemase family protein [Hyphomonas oceanitis]KDA04013.1 aspartate racemase [Hyphomonas oceanitis SCH89]